MIVLTDADPQATKLLMPEWVRREGMTAIAESFTRRIVWLYGPDGQLVNTTIEGARMGKTINVRLPQRYQAAR